jgi:DNA-binding transcriptional ArsR family regulator
MPKKLDDFNQIASIAKALSNPIRIEILNFLSKQTTCFHGDLADILPIAKSTLSQHLNELKDANLITGTISGNHVKYCINQEEWKNAQLAFHAFFNPIALNDLCKK